MKKQRNKAGMEEVCREAIKRNRLTLTLRMKESGYDINAMFERAKKRAVEAVKKKFKIK